jgi:hypothetical protein
MDILKEHAVLVFSVEEEAKQESSFRLHEEENLLCEDLSSSIIR